MKAIYDLLQCQVQLKVDHSIGKTIHSFLTQINELQNLKNKKLYLFMKHETHKNTDVYYFYKKVEETSNSILHYVHYFKLLANKFDLNDWIKKAIEFEVRQASVYSKKRLEVILPYKLQINNTDTIWLNKKALT